MKVDIKISKDIKEPYAIIYTPEFTDEIKVIADALETGNNIITATDNSRIIILKPDDIYMVRIENEQTVIYCCQQDAPTSRHTCHEKKFLSNKRLYEFEAQLGKNFMRISKSAIVNLNMIDSVEPSFRGMMCLCLKNGCKDYISRKYLPDFKKYLGI